MSRVPSLSLRPSVIRFTFTSAETGPELVKSLVWLKSQKIGGETVETGPKICLPVDKRNAIWFIFRTVKSEASEVCSRCYLYGEASFFIALLYK